MRTVWAVLGIAPTRDRTVVRRAYAARLKQTNPEDDPDGFQELRGAYELVLAQLSLPEMAEVEGVVGHAEYSTDDDLVYAEPGPPALSARQAEHETPPAAEFGPPPSDPISRHWQACRDLHQSIYERHPPAEEIDRTLAQILSSPVMENVSVRAETERGLAHTILSLAPHADGLIVRCIAFFGWEASINQFGAAPEVRAVVERTEILRFTAELERRRHAHHRAFEIMKRPPPSGRLEATLAVARHRGEIRDFFAYASRQGPGVFQTLPPETVAFWARYGRKAKPLFGRWKIAWSVRGLGFFLFLIYLLVRIFMAADVAGSGTGNEPLAPPSSMEMRTNGTAVVDGRAMEELKAGEVTKAYDDYNFALGQSPADPEALFGRGVTRTMKGDDAGNADKLAAVRRSPAVVAVFADPSIPASAMMVFDTPPGIVSQPKKRPVLPASVASNAPSSIEVRCLVGIDGDLHDCAGSVPLPSGQEALMKSVIKYVRGAKASPGRYRGAPVADAPILLGVSLGPAKAATRRPGFALRRRRAWPSAASRRRGPRSGARVRG